MTDKDDLIRRLAHSLDACLDHLDRQTARESRKNTGGDFSVITEQSRAKRARKAVDEAFTHLNLPRD